MRKSKAPASESHAQALKSTISLFSADNERLNAVQIALAKRGRRVSASHMIRLCIRALPTTKSGAITDETTERMLAILDEMKAEDGRVLRHQ